MYSVFTRDEYLKDKVGLEIMPAIVQKDAILHGVGCAISSHTGHPDEAWQFIRYLGSKNANDIFAKSGAGLPAYLASVDLFIYEEMAKGFNAEAFVEQLEYTTMYPCSKYTSRWQEIEREYLDRAWSGEMSVEDACKKIAYEMNKILAIE